MDMEKTIEEFKRVMAKVQEPTKAHRLARAMAVHAAQSFTAEEIKFTTRSMREKIGGASC